MRFNATDGVDERWCGKLVPCAAAHLARYSQLPKGKLGLDATKELPCGRYAMAAASQGVVEDVRHAPVTARLSALCQRKNVAAHCAKGCNDKLSPSAALAGVTAKMCLSQCSYSFCFEEVVNSYSSTGAVAHCPFCGVCRDYMYAHCARCDTCSYGAASGAIPSSCCHDLCLAHDGVVFFPAQQREQCPENPDGAGDAAPFFHKSFFGFFRNQFFLGEILRSRPRTTRRECVCVCVYPRSRTQCCRLA